MSRAPDLLLAAAVHAAARTRPAPPPETAHRPALPRNLSGARRPCGRPCRNGAPCDVTVLRYATCWRHR